MKLGFLTACLPDRPPPPTSPGGPPSNGYEALEVAAWPDLGDRPFTATHLDGELRRSVRPRRPALFDAHDLRSPRSPTTTTTCTPTRRSGRRSTTTSRVHRRRRRARRAHGGHVRRPPPGRTVAENLRDAEQVFPPLVDRPGERA